MKLSNGVRSVTDGKRLKRDSFGSREPNLSDWSKKTITEILLNTDLKERRKDKVSFVTLRRTYCS